MKNTNHKEASRAGFIELVSTEQNERKTICQVIKNDDKVRPFFDIETNKQLKQGITPNIVLEYFYDTFILTHFPEGEFVFASNHRPDKLSFHLIINGYYTSIIELKKISHFINNRSKQLITKFFEDASTIELIDTKVYRTSGLFRFSNQCKYENRILIGGNPVLSNQDLSKYIIIADETDRNEYICPINVGKVITVSNKQIRSQMVEEVHNQYDTSSPYAKQMRNLIIMLDTLGEQAIPFNIIVGSVKSWCNTKIVFDALDNWCKKYPKYYNHSGLVNRWNNSKMTEGISALHNKYVSKLSKEELKTAVRIKSMVLQSRFNPLNNISEIKGLELVKTASKYVNDINPSVYANKKYVFMKSDTGSGKTVWLKEKTKHFIKIIFTSRVVMADALAPMFDCRHYKKDFESIMHEYNNNGRTMMEDVCIQIDSLHKFLVCVNQIEKIGVEAPFVVIIDECDSIAKHFLNTMNGELSKNRLTFLNFFFKILHAATLVLACDRDISTPSIKFILNNLSDAANNSILVNNVYTEPRDNPVNFLNCEQLTNALIADAREGVKFVYCCDNKSQMNVMIETIKAAVPDFSFKRYMQEECNSDDFTNIEEAWKEQNVFFTPTIQYGIDYSPKDETSQFIRTHKVYCITGNGTIPSTASNQQIARVRHPISINICDTEHWLRKINHKSDNVSDTWLFEITKQHTILQRTPDYQIASDILIDSLEKFYSEVETNNKELSKHYSFHLENMLRDKGFNNITHMNTMDTVIADNTLDITDILNDPENKRGACLIKTRKAAITKVNMFARPNGLFLDKAEPDFINNSDLLAKVSLLSYIENWNEHHIKDINNTRQNNVDISLIKDPIYICYHIREVMKLCGIQSLKDFSANTPGNPVPEQLEIIINGIIFTKKIEPKKIDSSKLLSKIIKRIFGFKGEDKDGILFKQHQGKINNKKNKAHIVKWSAYWCLRQYAAGTQVFMMLNNYLINSPNNPDLVETITDDEPNLIKGVNPFKITT